MLKIIASVGLALVVSLTPAPTPEVSRPIAKLNTQATEIQGESFSEVSKASPVIVQAEKPPERDSGRKSDWLRASGIPESEWSLVDYLVSKESGWNPNAVNKSSGACGLGQQLPCGKWSGAWNDPVSALKNMHQYVLGRYGSWSNAVAHSKNTGWY